MYNQTRAAIPKLGDTIDAALGGPGGFVAILLMIGLVGGAVGGALEALSLRNHINRPPAR